MAMRPKRPCSKPGCRNLAMGRYCNEHLHLTEEQRKQRHKHYDEQRRDKTATSFYRSVEWQRAREQVLIRDHGLCQHCVAERQIKTADLVDHVKPLRLFWHLRLTLGNLQSLCYQHHAIKTQEDKRRYGEK